MLSCVAPWNFPLLFHFVSHSEFGFYHMAQMVKNLPAVQETWVQSLGWEDSPGEGMAIYSSNLAWRIPWTEEPGRLQFM